MRVRFVDVKPLFLLSGLCDVQTGHALTDAQNLSLWCAGFAAHEIFSKYGPLLVVSYISRHL